MHGQTYCRALSHGLSRTGVAGAALVLLIGAASEGSAQVFGPPAALNTNAASDSGADTEPQVATDRAGHWVAVWSSSESLGGTIGTDPDILVARSIDNGETWTNPVALNTNADSDLASDVQPQVTTDRAGAWVTIWHSQGATGAIAQVLVARSTDQGTTWTAPLALETKAVTQSWDYAEPQVTTDTSGNWVAVWHSKDSLGGADRDILVARSTDNGVTWTGAVLLSSYAWTDSTSDESPQVTTDEVGNWIAVWASSYPLGGLIGTDRDILIARSIDNGETWTNPVALNTNADSDSGPDESPQVTTDGAGNWVAVWETQDTLGGTIGTDFDCLVARSTDLGRTWTPPAVLNSHAATDHPDASGGDDFDPQVTTDGAGHWVAVWSSSAGAPGGLLDILLTRSTDKGASWSDPVVLNLDAENDWRFDVFPQLTTDKAGTWVAVWVANTVLTDRDILISVGTLHLPLLVEKSFAESSSLETLVIQESILNNGDVSGDLSGTINFSDFSLISVTTGPFAGKSSSRGTFHTTLEGASYQGEWKGVTFYQPQDRKIALKGTVAGEVLATVEGHLTESTPDSGIYDHYQATWKIRRLGAASISATITLNGVLVYGGTFEYPSTELRILQSNFEGPVSAGDYRGTPLDLVLTLVQVTGTGNPYLGEGFSIISYSSESGIGEGWSYAHVISAHTVGMEGLFDQPLYGVSVSTLYEETSPRKLFLSIYRIDVGLPPMADLEVNIWGPASVSPGQVFDQVLSYRNSGTASADNVVVVYMLPRVVDYISSTAMGIYKREYNEIVWSLGTLPPGTTGYLTAKLRVRWGLRSSHLLESGAMIGTTSPEMDTFLTGYSPIPDISRYLYSPRTLSMENITPDEFDDLLLTDPFFNEAYTYANQLGFVGTSIALRQEREDGSILLTSPMLSDFDNSEADTDLLFLIKLDDGAWAASFLIHINDEGMSVFDAEGGITYSSEQDSTDTWGSHFSCRKWACMANCITNRAGDLTLTQVMKVIKLKYKAIYVALQGILVSVPCVMATTEMDPEKREEYERKCLGKITGVLNDMLEKDIPLIEYHDVGICVARCQLHRFSEPGFFMCVPTSMNSESVLERCEGWRKNYRVVYHCNDACEWKEEMREDCEEACPPVGFWQWSGWCSVSGGGPHCAGVESCGRRRPNTGWQPQAMRVAKDPNIKYGPEGEITAGQPLNYRVEYENEGEGIAFGVYVTDTLDQGADDSTLLVGPVFSTIDGSEIAAPGTYDPITRTITWLIGEVGPKEGGYSDFGVNARDDLPAGTEIINFATVYFPSVPEVTPTNAIVSVIPICECGDGIVHETCSEQCDDGNMRNGDGCSASCEAERQSQNEEQRKCTNELNKNGARVAKEQGKENTKCVKDYAKEKIPSAQACLSEDRKGKVNKAKTKAITKGAGKCTIAPNFAATDAITQNNVMVDTELALIHDIFGSDLDAVIITEEEDKDISNCQVEVVKLAEKCQETKLKEFNKCKKNGLKDQSIRSFLDLQDCMDADPKDKIAKACATKLTDKTGKKCGGIDLRAAFPGRCENSVDLLELAVCVDKRVRCRVCLALNAVDVMRRDCDEFDDGAVNWSCP